MFTWVMFDVSSGSEFTTVMLNGDSFRFTAESVAFIFTGIMVS